MMKLANLKRTCIACPSQWEGVTNKGRRLYIRYRYGKLEVSLEGLYGGESRYIEKRIGDIYDGVMDTGKMLEETGLKYEGDIDKVNKVFRKIEEQNAMYFESDHGKWLEELAKERTGENNSGC